jgi:hypothetical protein
VPRGNGGDGSTADQRSADAALRLTQARANLARANGDEARALQILNDGLAKNANATETASLRVQTAAARLKNGTTYAQEFGQAVKSNLLSIVGPAALAAAAFAAVGKGVELGKSALALNRTIALTKELTGTQAAYDRVIAAARQQQLLYGGSLQENIAGIQGLVVNATFYSICIHCSPTPFVYFRNDSLFCIVAICKYYNFLFSTNNYHSSICFYSLVGLHKKALTCFYIRVIYHAYTLYLPSYRSQARVVVRREQNQFSTSNYEETKIHLDESCCCFCTIRKATWLLKFIGFKCTVSRSMLLISLN